MHELFQQYPDPDDLLAMEPEELGARLLFLVRDRLSREPRGHIHPGSLAGEVGYRDASRGNLDTLRNGSPSFSAP
jgi:hypothetical protein